MEQEIIFHPWDSCHKTPFGAVKTRENITLSILTPPQSQILGFSLILRRDKEESFLRKDLLPLPSNGYYNRYGLTFSVEEAGLYFYRFEAQIKDGLLFVGQGPDGRAVHGDFLPEWQLTVYDSGFSVPQKRQQGVMYQIFPDRFFRDGNDPVPAVKSHRLFHQSWEERPLFTMDQSPYEATDFFGGNLRGIIKKLPYLQSLGVTCLYLNPIFEAASNHRYNTGDYRSVDPYLGNEEDFKELVSKAKEYGIDLILDGVFSHTGSDSLYFNREGHYPSLGAWQSPDSPYASWYRFSDDRKSYDCWWGFRTLPNVNETDPGFLRYICGEEGVLRFWQRMGAAGWRLDVADELPDEFLYALRKTVKEADPEAFILGEVWEDASNKESYGKRRPYLLGGQLDSVMNYPFRTAVLDFIKTGEGELFRQRVLTIADHYPAPSLASLMNPLSTHDTVRALTFLGVSRQVTPDQQADFIPTEEEYQKGVRGLRLAALLQYTLPGVPCLYYGDEAGMSGFSDPWNRRTYPWGKEDQKLIGFFAALGQIRRQFPKDLQQMIRFLSVRENALCYQRGGLLILLNRGSQTETFPFHGKEVLISVGDVSLEGQKITTAPFSGAVVSL